MQKYNDFNAHVNLSSPHRTMNTLLLNELPQFNGLALQMIWSMLGTFSCLHKDLASDMEQLFQSFAQQVMSHVYIHSSVYADDGVTQNNR